jgi:hypothetical protein
MTRAEGSLGPLRDPSTRPGLGSVRDKEKLRRTARRNRGGMLKRFLATLGLRAGLGRFGAWKSYEGDLVCERAASWRTQDALRRHARSSHETRPRIGQMFLPIGPIEFGGIFRRRIDDQQFHGHDRFLWLEAYTSIGPGRGAHYTPPGEFSFHCTGISPRSPARMSAFHPKRSLARPKSRAAASLSLDRRQWGMLHRTPWLGLPMQFDRLKRREFIALVGGRTRRSAGTSWREQTRSLERLLQHRFRRARRQPPPAARGDARAV